MSKKEIDRLELIQLVVAKRLSVTKAAQQADLSRQRMSELVNAYRRDGATALVSRRRGRPSNSKFSDALKAQVCAIVREHYSDFGPTLAAEYLAERYKQRRRRTAQGASALASGRRGKQANNKLPSKLQTQVCAIVREHYSDFGPTLAAEYLAERHAISVSRETLRKWMVADGIWTTRAARRKRVQQRRQRRECRGELVQLDGSHHDWFEGRGPKCCLLVFIDDATSELLHLEFVPSESTFALMTVTRHYVSTHGRPLALYTDKAVVFRNASRSRSVSKSDADMSTQFTRALDELGIALIWPSGNNSAQNRPTFGTSVEQVAVQQIYGSVSNSLNFL